MTNTRKRIERRKHRRFSVSGDVFIALRPHYGKVGKVVDISLGGLAFAYMANGKSPSRSFELDIFSADRTFCLQSVPFRAISDFERDRIPFSSVKMRRSGMQFGNLTPYQKSQLELFIQNHTNGEVKEPER
jgi:hypothetical protein